MASIFVARDPLLGGWVHFAWPAMCNWGNSDGRRHMAGHGQDCGNGETAGGERNRAQSFPFCEKQCHAPGFLFGGQGSHFGCGPWRPSFWPSLQIRVIAGNPWARYLPILVHFLGHGWRARSCLQEYILPKSMRARTNTYGGPVLKRMRFGRYVGGLVDQESGREKPCASQVRRKVSENRIGAFLSSLMPNQGIKRDSGCP